MSSENKSFYNKFIYNAISKGCFYTGVPVKRIILLLIVSNNSCKKTYIFTTFDILISLFYCNFSLDNLVVYIN